MQPKQASSKGSWVASASCNRQACGSGAADFSIAQLAKALLAAMIAAALLACPPTSTLLL